MQLDSGSKLNTAFKIIYDMGSISRSGLAAKMGISVVTAGKLTAELIRLGYAVQFTRVSHDSGRSSLHLFPNKKLHLFLLDITTGKLYLSDILCNTEIIADFGNINNDNIFDKYRYLISDALEIISRQKYKNRCIGIFVTGSNDQLKFIADLKYAAKYKFTPIPYSDIAEFIDSKSYDRTLSVILSTTNLSFSYRSDEYVTARDIGNIISGGVKLSERIMYSNDEKKNAAVLAAEISNLDVVFMPKRISVFCDLYESKSFIEILSSAILNISRETSEKLVIESDSLDFTKITVRHIISKYIESIGR